MRVFAGYAVDSANKGLLEDIRMGLEIGVTKLVEAIRIGLRAIFFLPAKSSTHGLAQPTRLARHNTAPLPV